VRIEILESARDDWIAAMSIAGPVQGTPFRLDAAHLKLVVAKAAELSRRVSPLSEIPT